MKMETPTLVSLVLLPLLLFSSLSSAKLIDDLLLARPSFPKVQAEKRIRELHLSPKEDVNVIEEGRDSVAGPKIVERRFRFPNLTESAVSVEDLGHHAGYYKIAHSHDARLFYFFFESRNSNKVPVVIWLTGGPGTGSEMAMFYENGPFTIADNMSLLWNEYGWDQASNLLYVDQPTGSGFSYSSDKRDIRHDEDGVSDDLYDFLQAFFEEHPQFQGNDFYITGESYAGHYIPALAARVHSGNKAKEGIHINLKGFAIGNGLTDPAIQYKSYTDYALKMGIIKKSDYDRINKVVPVCEMALKLCGTDGTVSCVASYHVCSAITKSIAAVNVSTNNYDIRKITCGRILCYDFSNMDKFLGQKSVRDALGVPADLDFVFVNRTVNEAMIADYMRNLEVGIPALLEDGIKLLVYAGEYDFICNWLGNSRWVHAMEWSGQKEFVASPEVAFTVDGSEAGVLKSFGSLAFLKVHDAGHMVPMDQPKAALEMLERWIKGTLSEPPADPPAQTCDLL